VNNFRAHSMGARAFRIGRTEDACPFRDGHFRHCWLMGFIDARLRAAREARS
jgi:ribosome modulation factor